MNTWGINKQKASSKRPTSFVIGLSLALCIGLSPNTSASSVHSTQVETAASPLPISLHIPKSKSTLPNQKVFFIYKNLANRAVTLSVSGDNASLRLLHSGFREKSHSITIPAKGSVRVESVSPASFGQEKTVVFKINKKAYAWVIATKSLN